MLPTGFRTFHFVSFLYVFFFSFLFLLFRFFSRYFVFVFLRFVFFSFLFVAFLLVFFSFFFLSVSFRFFSFFFVSQFTGTPLKVIYILDILSLSVPTPSSPMSVRVTVVNNIINSSHINQSWDASANVGDSMLVVMQRLQQQQSSFRYYTATGTSYCL